MKEKLAQALEIEFHYTEVGFKNEPDHKKKSRNTLVCSSTWFGSGKSRSTVRFILRGCRTDVQ